MNIWGSAGKAIDPPLEDGWQNDPGRPGIQRYWVGGDEGCWDDSIAPRAKPEPAWKGARVIALGILMACATVFVVYSLSQPSDADCAMQRLEYATGDRALYDVDDTCR